MANKAGFTIKKGRLKQYLGSDAYIVIPEGVTKTCMHSFSYNEHIRKVVFPSTIEIIDNSSFSGCNMLEEVEFAGGGVNLKEIGFGAFRNCTNLKKIDLPNKSIVMGQSVFEGCPLLESDNQFNTVGSTLVLCQSDQEVIEVPEGIKNIGNRAFSGCSNAKRIVLPEGVEVIGEHAFSFLKNLELVSFPGSLKTIEAEAFSCCYNLQKADLTNVTRIGAKAFAGCRSLRDISFPKYAEVLGAEDPDGKHMEGVFDRVPAKHVVIPTSIKMLDSFIFMHNTELTDVTIPGNIKVIGKGAFWGCTNLKSVEIEEGVEEIKPQAFLGCEQLSNIKLPDSLKVIGSEAFRQCTNLKAIDIPSSIANGMSEAEMNNYLSAIGIPNDSGCIVSDGVLVRYDGLPGTIRITDGVKVIPKNVFSYWFSFRAPSPTTRIILPDSVRLIEDESFYNTWHLQEMNIPAGYLQQKVKLPKKATLILIKGVWRDKITIKDLVYLMFFQRDKDISSYCQKRLADDPEAAIAVFKEMLTEIGEKDHYAIVANFILENLKKISPDDINDIFQMAKDAKASKAVGLLEPLFSSDQIEKDNTKEGEAPTDVVLCALVPYMQLLKSKPSRDDYKYYDSPLVFPHLTFRKTADKVAATFNRDSFEKTLDSLIGKDLPSALETLIPYGRYASGKQISNLITRMKRWEKWSDYKKAGREAYIVAKGAIMLNDSKEAIMFAEKHRILDYYAKIRNTDEGTLKEKVLVDFGLDENGKKMLELGNTNIEVSVNQDLTLTLYDTREDKIVKSIPKRGADEKKYELAKAELADMKKNLKAVTKDRNNKLFEQFLSGKTEPADKWMESYLNFYVLHRIAELVVWSQKDKTFIASPNGVIDCFGNEYSIDEKTPIGVAHPMNMEPETVKAWQSYFTKNSLKQPFEQIWEPVQGTLKPDRYAGYLIPFYRFANQEKHGITIYGDGVYGDSDYAEIRLDSLSSTIKRHEWTQSINDKVEIESITTSGKMSRKANHILAYLDRITMNDRVRNNDATIASMMNRFTLAQIMDFIKIANENNCNEVLAILIDYKNKEFSDFDPMDEFVLE